MDFSNIKLIFKPSNTWENGPVEGTVLLRTIIHQFEKDREEGTMHTRAMELASW